MRNNTNGWTLWSVLLALALSGCAANPGAKLEEALNSNKAVIISPLLGDACMVWERVGDPAHRVALLPLPGVPIPVGQTYQMVVVEPGRYVLWGALVSAGPGRVDPRGLVPSPVSGALGQVKMATRSYREPYTARVWRDRIVREVNNPSSSYCAVPGPNGGCQQWGYTQGASYTQVVQEAGWYEETRYKPATDFVEFRMEFSPRVPMAWVDVKPAEAILINRMRVVARDAGYDYARCTAISGDYSHVCPLDRVRVETARIDLEDFRRQAAASGPRKMDPALIERVKAAPLAVSVKHLSVGSNGEAIFEFAPR